VLCRSALALGMTTIPTENDVLFGRGPATTAHPGNRRFRTIVDAQKQKFREEKERRVKRAIAVNIMDAIHSLQPMGRFLTEDHSSKEPTIRRSVDQGGCGSIHPIILNKAWVCVERDKAITKILQRLREKEVVHNQTLNSGSGQRASAAEESTNVTVSQLPSLVSYSLIGKSVHCPPLTDSSTTTPASKSPVPHSSDNAGQHESEIIDPTYAFEGSIPETDVDAFLQDFSAQHDQGEILGLRKLTLNEWMEESRLKMGDSGNVSEHIRSALPIALKLTEYLIEKKRRDRMGTEIPFHYR